MKNIILTILALFMVISVSAQITVNTNFKPNIAEPIDIRKKPIATLADTSSIGFPYEDLKVWVSDLSVVYRYDGTKWEEFVSGIKVGETIFYIQKPDSTYTINVLDTFEFGDAISPTDTLFTFNSTAVTQGDVITSPTESGISSIVGDTATVLRTYTDQAEQDAKDYADANDDTGIVDSTRLLQDSILIYYQDGSEIGRDTIAGAGVSGSTILPILDTTITSDGTDLSDATLETLFDSYSEIRIDAQLEVGAGSNFIISLVNANSVRQKKLFISGVDNSATYKIIISGIQGNPNYTLESGANVYLQSQLINGAYEWVFINKQSSDLSVTTDLYTFYSNDSIPLINNNTDVRFNFKQSVYADERITGVFDHRLINSSYTGPAYTVENSAGDTLQVNFLSQEFGSLPDTSTILAFDDTVYVKRWYNQTGSGFDFEVGSTSATGRGPLIVLDGSLIKENGTLALEYIKDGSTLEAGVDIWGVNPSVKFLQVIQNYNNSFPVPTENTSAPTNEGFVLYAQGANMRIHASGYDKIIGETEGFYQLSDIMPLNEQVINSFLLTTDTIISHKNGAFVTPDSIYTGSVTPFLGLMIGRLDNNAASSFWYYDGKIQQLIVSGSDVSDLIEEMYTETSNFYNSSIIDEEITANQIDIQIEAANSDNRLYELSVNSTGEDGTVRLTGSKFLNRNTLSDTLVLDLSGNSVVDLSSVAYQDTFAWKINYPIIDNAVIDTITNRLYSTFVYVSQESSLNGAIQSANANNKILVIDQVVTQTGSVDLLDLDLIFTEAGRLNVDTLTASGAYFEASPRKIFGDNTIIQGNWNCSKSYIEWTAGKELSDSLSNWIGFRNAIELSRNIQLLSKEYRLSGSSTYRYGGDKEINITGVGADNSIIVLTNASYDKYIYAEGTSKGSPLSIKDVTFKTTDYEQGLANQNNAFTFAAVQRTSTNENVYTDFSKVEIKNCNFFGEISFIYETTGSASTFPDSVSFATSGIDFVNIENCKFDGPRGFFSMGNTLATRAVIRNNLIENLSGAFVAQSSTLPDSLGGGYDISEFYFQNNTVQNDSVINYFGGGYLTPLLVKANKVRFEGNTIKNLAKYSSGADVHICYPSAEQFWLVNNKIEDVTEFASNTNGDENSVIKFKGAQQAYIIGNDFKISEEKLIEYNILDSNLNITNTDYGLNLIAKEAQSFYRKGIVMHDNTFNIPVLNISTDITDVSKFDIQDNIFNVGRWADEPTGGTAGNTKPYHIFFANQGSAVRDTTSSHVSKGNIWNIKNIDSTFISYMDWASTGDPGGLKRLTPLVHYEDEWNINNAEVRFYPYNSERYINRSTLNGSGNIKNFATKNITPKYEFEDGIIDITVRESTNTGQDAPVFPSVPYLQGKYTVLKNSSDSLRLMEGSQGDWFNGWIESKDSVLVTYRIEYRDTTGDYNEAEWKIRYGIDGSTKTWFYKDGSEVNISPSEIDTFLVDANNTTPIELKVGGNYMKANLVGLSAAKSYTIYCNIESNTNASIEPTQNFLGRIDSLELFPENQIVFGDTDNTKTSSADFTYTPASGLSVTNGVAIDGSQTDVYDLDNMSSYTARVFDGVTASRLLMTPSLASLLNGTSANLRLESSGAKLAYGVNEVLVNGTTTTVTGGLTVDNYTFNSDQDTTGLNSYVLGLNSTSGEIELKNPESLGVTNPTGGTNTVQASLDDIHDLTQNADTWDNVSQFRAYGNGVDMASTVFSVTDADKRNFNIHTISEDGVATSHTEINLPTASATYFNHRITITSFDDDDDYNNVINGTQYGAYTLANGEQVDLICSLSNGSYQWYLTTDRQIDLGWENIISNDYTSGSPLVTLAGDTSTINFNGATSINRDYLPVGVDSFLNRTTNTFNPVNVGDNYEIRVSFTGESSVSNDGNAYVLLDIGGANPIVEQEQIFFTKGANIPQSFSVHFSVFTLDTFIANGGTFKIESITGTTDIYDVKIYIKKDFNGSN